MSLFAQMGDSTGQWGLAGDSIPVYSKVQGKTVYVRVDQAQAYVANDAVQYAKRKSTSLPKKGKPNSKETSYKPDGSKKQDRYYGPDGEPVLDVDQPHGNVDYPHAHGWNDGVRDKEHKPVPGWAQNSTPAITADGAAWTTFGTVAAVAVVVVAIVLIPVGI